MSVAGDVYELAITTFDTTNSTYIVNVFHFRAVTSGCTATSLIADWRANVETEHRAVLCTSAQIQRYLAFNLIPYSTDTAEQRVTLAGTSSTIPLPAICAVITTWRSSQIGRRYRGRTYWGPIAAGDVTGGVINSSPTTGKFAILANKILGRYGATGTSTDTRIGVWSRVNGGQQPPHLPDGFTQITNMTVQRNVGSMGTRRVGRGM